MEIRALERLLLYNLGCEVVLSPVTWDTEGWPHIGPNGVIEIENDAPRPAPVTNSAEGFYDAFSGKDLGLQWTFVRRHKSATYRAANHRLYFRGDVESLNRVLLTVTLIRQREFRMYAKTSLECNITNGCAGADGVLQQRISCGDCPPYDTGSSTFAM